MTTIPPNPQAQAKPPAPAGAGAGTPPFGSSPATGPTQNRGYEAAGLQKLAVIVKLMSDAVPLLGASSDPGKDLLKALQSLAKHIPPGSVSPAAEQNTMQSLAMKQAQQGPQIQQMRQQAAQPQAAA